MTHAASDPWLLIPASEYEAHMAEIGQSAALRQIFANVYAATTPRRLLILGCTTGQDFALIDPAVTETSVGVDVNRDYLDIARVRLDGLQRPVTLVADDVLQAKLPPSLEFDLIYAALIFEYVDPAALLHRIAGWLAAGGSCATVTQNPTAGVGAVSRTAHQSLNLLDGQMALHESELIHGHAREAGLERITTSHVQLPLGKSFSVSVFRKA